MYSNTTGASGPLQSQTINIISFVCVLLIAIVGFLGNLLVLVTVLKCKPLHKVPNTLIASMAIVDILNTGFAMPISLAGMALQQWVFGGTMCQILGWLVGAQVEVSGYHLVAISVNRYISIVHMSKYKQLATTRNTLISIALIWSFSLLLTLAPIVGWGRIHYEHRDHFCMYDWRSSESYSLARYFLGNVLMLIIIIFCYSRIVIVVKRSKQRICQHGNNPRVKDVRLAFQLSVMVAVFFICWTPYMILNVIVERFVVVPHLVHLLTAALIVGNSACNPPLYFLLNQKMRTHMKTTMTCCWTSQTPVTELTQSSS